MSEPVVPEDVKAKVPEQTVTVDSLDNAIPASESADASQQQETFKIPDKFKDKSIEEVIQAYTDLEKMSGKQGSELGELRKLTDQYILSAQGTNVPQPADNTNTQENDRDFNYYEEPEKAIESQVKEAIKPYEQELFELRQEKFAARLSQDHPDYQEIFADNNFHEWLKASPIRLELFARADRDYNYDAANEMFLSYKASTGASSKVVSGPDQDTIRAATVETTDSAVETSPKKLYRRADIIELKRVNPQRYQALESEILEAYRDGRVVT